MDVYSRICMYVYIYNVECFQSQRKNEIITFTEKCYETEKHMLSD